MCEAFTYNFKVDAEDKLTRLFWCDPTSQRNYQLYGQVVAFDTTYSTNKYCMIFAPFTGKDNHGKPVTFAAGLLTKEDAASFTWLFQEFKSCMSSSPTMIITDQDLGMKVAVEVALSGTRHRWCMWHIMLKVADKITKELRADEDFKKELNACVWAETIEPHQFENSWEGIIVKYGLQGNQWFETMYENRNYWVLAYFRDLPLSGLMKTTSISECENSFYKRYTRSRANLLEFWTQYSQAIEAQRYQNSKMNYQDQTYAPRLCTQLYMEKHAARVYTTKIFMQVQEEIVAAQSRCAIKEITEDAGYAKYGIVDQYNEEHRVTMSGDKNAYECSCKMFGRMGLQCSHVLCVMKNNFVQTIPERYIHERWKKSHLINTSWGSEAEDMKQYVNIEENRMLKNKITTTMYGWLQKFEGDNDKLTKLLTTLQTAGEQISDEGQSSGVIDKEQMFQKYYGTALPENVEVHPLENVKTKGSGSRLVSRREKAAKKKEKPLRRCNNCKQMANHDARNCNNEPK